MDKELLAEIAKAEKEGWKLCAGCGWLHTLFAGENYICPTCPLETRKKMGLSPERAKPQDDLPENPYLGGERIHRMIYWQAQQDMLRAGYRRCPKK